VGETSRDKSQLLYEEGIRQDIASIIQYGRNYCGWDIGLTSLTLIGGNTSGYNPNINYPTRREQVGISRPNITYPTMTEQVEI